MTTEVDALGISGLVLPGSPANDVDIFRRMSVRALIDRARHLIELSERDPSMQAEPNLFHLVAALAHILDATDSAVLYASFNNPVAYLDVPPPVFLEDGVLEKRNATQRAAALIRHIIGSPISSPVMFVLPGTVLPPQGLYLPHYHALLHGAGGPVAVHLSEDTVRLTWSDGVTVSLPPPPAVNEITSRDGRLVSGPRAAGLPVLNICPEVTSATQRFGLIASSGLPAAQSALEGGMALLHQIWPEAHADAERMLVGWVILALRDHTRSHTSPRMQGSVMLTAEDAITVGDLICHEVSHMRMNLVLEQDPLVVNGVEAVHPSPWRKDLRPMIGIFNGVHAFINVCNYYRHLQDIPPMQKMASEFYKYQREKVEKGLRYLQRHGAFTPLGASIVHDFEEAASAL